MWFWRELWKFWKNCITEVILSQRWRQQLLYGKTLINKPFRFSNNSVTEVFYHASEQWTLTHRIQAKTLLHALSKSNVHTAYTIMNNQWPMKSEMWVWKTNGTVFTDLLDTSRSSFQATNFLDYSHWAGLPGRGRKTGIAACQQQAWPLHCKHSGEPCWVL